MRDKKKTAYLGVYLALALICSYVESLIPFYFGIPGVKLGLTNIVVVLMLYCVGTKEALAVSALRIVLAGFLFGNMFSILYSLAGGLLSFLVMYLLKRMKWFGVLPVSVSGGIFHNVGQLIVAAYVVENYNILLYAGAFICRGTDRFPDRHCGTGNDKTDWKPDGVIRACCSHDKCGQQH